MKPDPAAPRVEPTAKQEILDYLMMSVQIAHLRPALHMISERWNPFTMRRLAREALQASQDTEKRYRGGSHD